jgi:hypothetical protein
MNGNAWLMGRLKRFLRIGLALCGTGIIGLLPGLAASADEQPGDTKFAYSHGAGIVPGAIICPDFQTTRDMFERYTAAAEDKMRYAIAQQQTGGHAREMYGDPPHGVDLAAYGCALIPSGQKMKLGGYLYGQIPMVIAKLPNGKEIKGVTLPYMATRSAP